MPRRARIMLPGVAVHVIQRANNRAACFAADEDRAFYLFHLGRMLMRTACNLHAYCLMGNHVHLLLTPENMAACSHLMKGIGQLYSQYVNKLYKQGDDLERIRAATNGGYLLGDRTFRAMMARKLGRRVEKGRAGRPARGEVEGQLDLLSGN